MTLLLKKAAGKPRPRRQRGLTVLELLIGMFIISILAVVGLPAYEDYRVRAQVAADFPLVKVAQQAIEEYYATMGVLPSNNNQVGLEQYFSWSPTSGLNFKMLIYNSWLGGANEPTILLVYNTDDIPQLDGWETLAFYAEENNGYLKWDCTQGGSMPNKYRPANCRR